MNIEDVYDGMNDAGFLLREFEEAKGRIPSWGAFVATSARPEDGRRDATVSMDDSDWRSKANQSWFAQANEFNLFDDKGEFLVSVNLGPDDAAEMHWARVKMAEDWDLFGRGSYTGIFGADGFPEFSMISTGGSVIVRGTTWQYLVGSLALPNPGRSAVMRDYIQRRASDATRPTREQEEGIAWLRQSQGPGKVAL